MLFLIMQLVNVIVLSYIDKTISVKHGDLLIFLSTWLLFLISYKIIFKLNF